MDLPCLIGHWKSVRAGLNEVIDKYQDGELDFRPFYSSWPVRQLMLHVAQEERGEFGYAERLPLPGALDTVWWK